MNKMEDGIKDDLEDRYGTNKDEVQFMADYFGITKIEAAQLIIITKLEELERK